MVCPFLSESQMCGCRIASVRKLVPKASLAAAERCSTPHFTECPIYEGQPVEGTALACPYLEETLAQFCSAAPLLRYVPWSEAALSRCGSSAFHYCDLYLDMTEASSHRTDNGLSEVEELPVPANLFFSSNHMWLDRAEDGLCHIGVDAFFARLLGPLEHVEFLTLPGVAGRTRQTPAAVIRAGGHDWHAIFPRTMTVSACNLKLRTNPERLGADPFGRGWLFAGTDVDCEGLKQGESAAGWMLSETRAMNEFVQERSNCHADGGIFEPGVLHQLRRLDALVVYKDFLSPFAAPPRERDESGNPKGLFS
jgi:glycine cleavage system H lipoate-binding protein